MSNSKDRAILACLIFFMMLVCLISRMADREIDALNKTIDYLVAQQKATDSKIDTMIANQSDEDKRLADIEEQQRDIKESVAMANEHIDSLQTEVDSHTEQIKAIPTQKSSKPSLQEHAKPKYNLSEKEIRLIASLVYLEAGSQSTKCQQAIASVVINRMNRYHMTARQVIYENGVFSVAYKVARTKPSQQSLNAVRYVVNNGVTTPKNVLAFRNGHYHSFGRRWKCIDGVYFTRM